MYDMTPLTRYEVAGPGAAALLQRLTTNNVDKSVGSVTYTVMLDDTGGIRSDLTVARLAPDTFQVGANSPMDFDWLSGTSPTTSTLRDITGGTCCLGVWGPRPATWCSRCARTTCRTRASRTSAPCTPISARSP